jgi:hypothetical protein
LEIIRDMGIIATIFGDNELEQRVLVEFRRNLEVPTHLSAEQLVTAIENFFADENSHRRTYHTGFENKLFQILALVAVENQLKPRVEKGLRNSVVLRAGSFRKHYMDALGVLRNGLERRGARR